MKSGIALSAVLCCAGASVATTAQAADAPAPVAARAQAELRAACAQNYASYLAYYPLGTKKSYQFAGDRIPGDNRHYADAPACSEDQFALFLDKADPALVMTAYPSAAGRPKVRPAAASAPKTGY